MSTFNVSNATELKSAIANAVGGDRIVLADGDYGNVNIFSRNFASTVTIEAAMPGTGAHLDGLFVAGSQNLNFVGLDIGRALNAGEPTYTQLSWIKSSSNITLDGVHIHGSLDGNPANDGVGLTVTSVTGFEVTNSKFEDLYRGLVLQKSSNATIRDNEITMIRSDGIISAANDDLLIQGNHIGEFRPNAGDHADAIQFWNTGQTKGQSNITIKDNEIFQTYFGGKEGTGIQGIFMSDPLTYGYQNVRIENNALYSNDAYNGIYVNGATDVQLIGNTVVSKSTDSKLFWIKLQDSSHIALHDNVTDRVITQNVTDFTQGGTIDFTTDPAARAKFPNLASPTGIEDLVLDGVGYRLPAASPAGVGVPPPAPIPNDDLQIAFQGDSGNNMLVGNAADNRINGGLGADVMYGHAGNDTYFVDNSGDIVIESVGNGSDTVIATTSYTLTAGSEIEHLLTMGSASTYAADLTGNEFNNIIVGNAADNRIDGGVGADTMWGYGGNDTYFVDNSRGVVQEFVGQGYDTVITTASFTLTAGSEVELLRTMGSASTYAINLGGNEFNNTIVGNAADNQIDGGAGADAMWGYGGNDTYFVDNSRDTVTELAGGGNDAVIAKASFRLGAGSEIELLRTMGSASTYAVDLGGNEFDNTIVGNAAANTIHGGAGNDSIWGYGGNDVLFGDQGNDTFVFGADFGKDTIVDFAGNGDAPGDTIAFQGGTFASFGDLMAHASQQGADAVFTLDAHTSLTLHGIQLAALSAQDFTFA
jgi:Ca2+-binding RTX toxin-like protein